MSPELLIENLLAYAKRHLFLPEEDEEAVRFAQQLGAVPVPVPSFADVPRLPSPDSTLCVCPDGTYEGFFLAAFTKRS